MAKLYFRQGDRGELLPIKTAVAEHYPQLTRRERRELARREKKMLQRAERRKMSLTV